MYRSRGNIYVSMTQDGIYALEELLKHGKRIDEVVTIPSTYKKSVSDYADFSQITRCYDVRLTITDNINSLTGRYSKDKPNVIIVNGWSQLLDQKLLQLPKYKCVGTHPALLPKNRGRAAIAWHFINREKYGGVSLFYLDESADGGPIIDQARFKISAQDNASSYYKKITQLGARLLVKHFNSISDGSAIGQARKQDTRQATFLLKRRPEDSRLDFKYLNAREIHDLVRAVSNIYPLAYFSFKGRKYSVLASALPRNIPRISGIPGQIARSEINFIWVICKDSSLVAFTSILLGARTPVNMALFKTGEVLNEA